jgi:hypothetical protein
LLPIIARLLMCSLVMNFGWFGIIKEIGIISLYRYDTRQNCVLSVG